MVKTEGAVYAAVVDLLKKRGKDPTGLKIATLRQGTEHLVVLGDDTVGEYNHKSCKLLLYEDLNCTMT